MYFWEILAAILLLLVHQFKDSLTLALIVWAVLFSGVATVVVSNWTNEPIHIAGQTVANIVGRLVTGGNGQHTGL